MSYAAAYQRTVADTETPRQIERRLMSRVTGALEHFQPRFDATGDANLRLAVLADGLGDAVWENQRLWQNFLADLSDPANALPAPLRAGLISIGLWVERHSQQVLRGKAGVAALVEVNNNIIRGLSGQGAQPAPTAAAAAPRLAEGV
ncbi:flagellar biosynthesis regulator FlaF [Acidimangrovimonas sediminis]|uniref:flagellar biosynthesis regulator FlaF n=1 Tax=Acidimangrovimonas sediminis TaxID=2056283 RepID=UPI000C80AFCF|nr:flagellar biosynthesis regulator FlaF [Acidimangrovimonas sediminis]